MQAQQLARASPHDGESEQDTGIIRVLGPRGLGQTEFPVDELNGPARVGRVEAVKIGSDQRRPAPCSHAEVNSETRSRIIPGFRRLAAARPASERDDRDIEIDAGSIGGAR